MILSHFLRCSYYCLKAHGEVFCQKGSNRPVPLLPEGLLDECFAVQLPLEPQEEEKVSQHQIRRIRQILNYLGPPGYHQVGHHGGGVHRCIVPIKPPVPGGRCRYLLLQNPQEASQDLNDVCSVVGFPSGHKVCLDKALRIEESQYHLIFLVAWTLDLIGPGMPFTNYCLDCYLVQVRGTTPLTPP